MTTLSLKGIVDEYFLSTNTKAKVAYTEGTIKNIIVTDVFGQDILIRPAGTGPDSAWQRWALFHHTDRINRNSPTNLFYVAHHSISRKRTG